MQLNHQISGMFNFIVMDYHTSSIAPHKVSIFFLFLFLFLKFLILYVLVNIIRPCKTLSNISTKSYCDTSLNFTVRASSLVAQLSVSQKITQLSATAPPIPEVGLMTATSFSTDALQGVQSTCVPSSKSKVCNCPNGAGGACTGDCSCATIFPTTISLGATFDAGLWKSIGTAVGYEARALAAFGGKSKAQVFSNDSTSVPSSTVGPVLSISVNVLRDGRWGRSQELIGEDPMMVSDYATNYLHGLQYTTHRPNATASVLGLGICKYFVGYSLDCVTSSGQACAMSQNNGNARGAGTFDSILSAWDLAATYSKGFSACANVFAGGVACGPNSVNGIPSCANSALLNDMLRQEIGFQGFVAGAQNAVEMIGVPFHNFTSNPTESAGAALKAGTDIDESSIFQSSLEKALDDGLVSKTTLDAAVTRLITARLRLGELDFAPNESKFGDASLSKLSSSTHTELNERAAYEGVVLLQNNATTSSLNPGLPKHRLPLDVGSIKKVAMIGPHADAKLNLLGSAHGSFKQDSLISPYDFLRSRLGNASIELAPGCNATSCDETKFKGAVAAARDADIVIAGLGLCGAAPRLQTQDPLVDASCIDANGAYEAPGYDRVSFKLPKAQVDLVKAVAMTGTPVVVFLINGGPLDFSEVSSIVEGVIWAGYPGAAGGKAIGSAFIGLLSPGSVMPYTTYSDSYINETRYSNMSMLTGKGRSYKYFDGSPQIPFGFGLSYSQWQLAEVSKKFPSTIKESSTAAATISLRNYGPYSGDRVVLLYGIPMLVCISFETFLMNNFKCKQCTPS